jgi:hypothetical protein
MIDMLSIKRQRVCQHEFKWNYRIMTLKALSLHQIIAEDLKAAQQVSSVGVLLCC